MFVVRLIIIMVLSFSIINGNDFSEIKKISLKKDVQTKILVKYGKVEKIFKFRWTLYKNKGLVIFKSYDKIVSQNILYLNHSNQSLRVELKPRGADFYNVPYLLVKFKEFDFEKNEALFELYLSDVREQINLKYLN